MQLRAGRLHAWCVFAGLLCAAPTSVRAETAEASPGVSPTASALAGFLAADQDPASGLLVSYPQSAEHVLRDVAFTYDMAVSALVLTHQGRLPAAERALALYLHMPLPADGSRAFNTAYHVTRGLPTLEYRLHAGPACWIAISLIRFGERANRPDAIEKGLALLDWLRTHLHHVDGGLVMGTEEPWDYILSTENNWVYYGALRVALPHVSDASARRALRAELREVRGWLGRHIRQRGEDDPVRALDVYTHALLVGPEAHLENAGIDRRVLAVWAKEWVGEIEALFHVPGTARYDYTDAREARQAGRARAGWLEGTEQVAVAYQTWAPFFDAMGDREFARQLRLQATLAHRDVLRFGLADGRRLAIPNTDAEAPFRNFSDGWVTRPRSEPALNGTNWAYLAEVGYNPLTTPASRRR